MLIVSVPENSPTYILKRSVAGLLQVAKFKEN